MTVILECWISVCAYPRLPDGHLCERHQRIADMVAAARARWRRT